MSLSSEERERYHRHILVLGEKAQLRLKSSVVLVAGAGGLGSVVSYYLAAMGVGKLVLVDDGDVELSNLNRQILYATRDIGRAKVLVAAEKLRELNPNVEVVPVRGRLDYKLAAKLIEDHGVNLAVDALDNWETRLELNRACVEKRIPLIHAAVEGFYGQLLVVVPGSTPCLHCVFARARTPRTPIPVLPPVVAAVASIEVAEAVKLLTGAAEPVLGVLIIYDAVRQTLDHVRVERNPSCPVCGALR